MAVVKCKDEREIGGEREKKNRIKSRKDAMKGLLRWVWNEWCEDLQKKDVSRCKESSVIMNIQHQSLSLVSLREDARIVAAKIILRIAWRISVANYNIDTRYKLKTLATRRIDQLLQGRLARYANIAPQGHDITEC